MKTVLCFGDSNTWGYDPDSGTRYPLAQRWPSVMQRELGSEWQVIPEGLNGRTTVFRDPFVPGRSGVKALPMLLATHAPLDLVVIMLGTNDVKRYFGANPAQIGLGMARLGELVKAAGCGPAEGAPELLLVAPVPLAPFNGDMALHFTPEDTALEASRALAEVYRQVAAELGCRFFDAAASGATVGSDGVHLDAQSQATLGRAIAEQITTEVDGRIIPPGSGAR